MGGYDLGEPAIERARRDAPVPYRVDVDDGLHQPIESLAGKSGNRHHRHTLDLRNPMIGLLPKLADRSGAAFDKIPFVHADDQGASFPLDEIGNAQVLFLEQLFRVDQQITTSANRIALSPSATESFSSFSSMRDRRRSPAVS